MTFYSFNELTYVVLYPEDESYVIYQEMTPGTELESPLTVEQFTDEALAIDRAEELGYVFPELEVLP